jgi:hypothetical protein
MKRGKNLKTIEPQGNAACEIQTVHVIQGGVGSSYVSAGGSLNVYFGQYNIFGGILSCTPSCGALTDFTLSSISPNSTKAGQSTIISQAFFQDADKNGRVVPGAHSEEFGFGFAIWDPSIRLYNVTGSGGWQCPGGTSGKASVNFQLNVTSFGATELDASRSVCPQSSVGYNLSRNSIGALGSNAQYPDAFGCSIAYKITPASSPASLSAQYGILQTMQWPDSIGFVNPRSSGAVRKGNGKVIDCPVDFNGKCKNNESIKNIVNVTTGDKPVYAYTANNAGAFFTAPYILASAQSSLDPLVCYKSFSEGDSSLYTNYTSYLMMKIKGDNNFWVPVKQASLSIQLPSSQYPGYGDCYAYCENPPCGTGAGTVEDPFKTPWNTSKVKIEGPSLDNSWSSSPVLPTWDRTSLPLNQGAAVVAVEGSFENSQGNFYYYCNWAYDKEYCPAEFPEPKMGLEEGELLSSEAALEYDVM